MRSGAFRAAKMDLGSEKHVVYNMLILSKDCTEVRYRSSVVEKNAECQRDLGSSCTSALYPFVKKTYSFKNRSYNFEGEVLLAIPKMALPVFESGTHGLPSGSLFR